MDRTAVRIIDVFDTVDELVCALFLMTLPFGWQFSIIPLLLFMALMLRKALQERNKPSRDKLLYFLPVFAYFATLLISLLYSSNPTRGVDLIVRKISMLLIPLLLLFTDFNPSIARKGVRFFALGTLLVSLLYYAVGIYHSTKFGHGMLCIIPAFSGDTSGILDTDVKNNYLMGEAFTFLMHPSYVGVLFALSLISVINSLVHEHNSLLTNRIAIPVFLACGGAMLLLSTNGALVTTLITTIFLIGMAIRYKSYLDLKTYWIVFVAIMLVSGSVYNPQFQTLLRNDKLAPSVVLRSQASTGVEELIRDHPILGVGNGDLDKSLNEKYQQMGFAEALNMGLNPHNQYLHTWAESGILALLSLLWLLGTLLWYGIKRHSIMMVALAVVFGANFFFESMLNRYWGILFFAVFYSLLYFHSEPVDDSE